MMRRITIIMILCACIMLLLTGAALAQTEQQPIPGGDQPPTDSGSQPASGNVYFYQNGALAGVSRDIAGGSQMAEFALLELVKGPTDEEKALGYQTFIPDGVKLQYSTIKQDRSEYSVCLSSELLGLEGDSERAAKALEQIDKTLEEVTGISNIGITVASQDMGGTPEYAYAVLGVAKNGGPGAASESSGGSTILIIIIIVIAVLLLAALTFLFLFVRKRKAKPAVVSAKGGKRPSNRTKK
jgi:Sporulation and spore germination